MKKSVYLYIIFFSFVVNFLYYVCFILLKTDNSLLSFYRGLADNFPTSMYYLVPSIIPSLFFILFGIIIYKQKNISYNLFLGLILIGLDIVFIKFLYGKINIDRNLLLIRILFVASYVSIFFLCLRNRRPSNL